MDEFLKMLIEVVEKNKSNTINMNKNNFMSRGPPEIAHANKILYDAHIHEGFTSEEALALVIATLN